MIHTCRPGARFEVASGKRLADEMRALLARMVEITEAMDEYDSFPPSVPVCDIFLHFPSSYLLARSRPRSLHT